MAFLGKDFGEIAARVCVGVAAAAFGLPPGSAEGMLGVADLIKFIKAQDEKFGLECARVRERIGTEIQDNYKNMISGSDGSWQADADLQAADHALQECLKTFSIDRAALVKAAVSPEGLHKGAVVLAMEGLARQRPDLFGQSQELTLAYRYAHDVISAGMEQACDNKEFYRSLEPKLVSEMAQILGQVDGNVKKILDNQKMAKEYEQELEAAKKSSNENETVLLCLLHFILERPIPKEDIPQALVSAYQQLTILRDSFGDLTKISNEVPEIFKLLQQADAALRAGGDFSLDRADEALKAADAQYQKIIAAREEQIKDDKIGRANILAKRAQIAMIEFRYTDVESLLRGELDMIKAAHGEYHEHTARSYNNLARSLNDQGKYKAAEPLLRKALEICKRRLGIDHLDTATSYNNLAYNLKDQGKYKVAESLCRKAIEVYEVALGKNHPHTAISYNNLAGNLDMQGKYSDAEPLYRKALKINKVVLGINHLNTATNYNNLAYNLNKQGKYQDAEQLYRKALEIRERRLGIDHPDTAASYNNVASNLNAQGKYQDAEPLFRKALEIRERRLGVDHPDTAISYSNLACNLDKQGEYKDAEPLFRKALKINKVVLGINHLNTATNYNNLASNLSYQGEYKDAEQLYRKALEIRERLGIDHPDTAASYNNVAGNLNAQGKYQDAEPLFRKALAICERMLGKDHPHTISVGEILMANLKAQGKSE